MELRHLIVDTDTGSDDVWGIVEALRAKDIVNVEAITTVCGNLPLELCVKNACIAAEQAGGSAVPVYKGADKPLNGGEVHTAFYAHGEDGLGNQFLPAPERDFPDIPAYEAIINKARELKGSLEIVTIGPLTNIALALKIAPEIAGLIKHIWILGGSYSGRGNVTDWAEYNIYVDPEAAAIVLGSGLNATWITWDTSRGDTEFTDEELEMIKNLSSAGTFLYNCVSVLRVHQKEHQGDNLGVIDAMAVTACLYPEIMEDCFKADCSIEMEGEKRGAFTYTENAESNNEICPRINAEMFKERLTALIRG